MTVPFLQVKPKSVKLKVSPRFPAQLLGRVGIDVQKQNGNYYLDLDYSAFPPFQVIPPPDVPNLYTLLYNIVTRQFELVQISTLGSGGGGGGGIPEAPTDGFTYGRNASTWTRVLALSGGTLTGPIILSGDPAVALGAATKQYVDTHTFADAPSDSSSYGRRNGIWSKVLDLSGGTMAGPLTLAADPTGALQAATKQYADIHPFADAASDGSFYARFNGSWAKVLGLAGGTLTGPLALASDPTVATQAATKNYVDNAVAGGGGGGGIPDAPSDGFAYGRRNAAWITVLQLAGGTMTGALLLQGDPTTALGAATKQYVDSHGGLVDAPNDGSAYGRLSGVWAKVVPLAGGTLTGPLILAADPSTALGAATKQYVDGHGFADAPNDGSTYGRKNLGWSKALDLAGGTLTGPLLLAADPTVALGAATKQYVDAATTGAVHYDAAQTLTTAQKRQAQSNTLLAPTVTVLTSGTGTYATPAGCTYLKVRMIGAGGGGGSTSSAGNASGTIGSPGGATTFSFSATVLTANGGNGGQQGYVGGGSGSGGTATIAGGASGLALSGNAGGAGGVGTNLSGPAGAATPFGGGTGGPSGNPGANASANTGSGGASAGGPANGYSGGGGGGGGYIDALIPSPNATYAYAIGGGGGGGTGGTGGFAGGTGGSGIIIVEEHYGS
jgi:hypothetical protein